METRQLRHDVIHELTRPDNENTEGKESPLTVRNEGFVISNPFDVLQGTLRERSFSNFIFRGVYEGRVVVGAENFVRPANIRRDLGITMLLNFLHARKLLCCQLRELFRASLGPLCKTIPSQT